MYKAGDKVWVLVPTRNADGSRGKAQPQPQVIITTPTLETRVRAARFDGDVPRPFTNWFAMGVTLNTVTNNLYIRSDENLGFVIPRNTDVVGIDKEADGTIIPWNTLTDRVALASMERLDALPDNFVNVEGTAAVEVAPAPAPTATSRRGAAAATPA